MVELQWCSSCLAMSTRPRITFSPDGRCSACVWAESKRTTVNWDSREEELTRLLDRHRGRQPFDCLVPVSGGKDGSYVADALKRRYGMSPLCVTVTPPLERDIGKRNLENFKASGFAHIQISPNPHDMRALDTWGLRDMGMAYFGWLTAILTSVLQTAERFSIPLVFYGEDGEVEYGGSSETVDSPLYSADYMRRVYLESGYDKAIEVMERKLENPWFFSFPEIGSSDEGLEIAHWSYFESWDPYRNYLVAKERCGLQESEASNEGTFTNFAQNDQSLYALHTYLMYLKFGFGRANQDASIEIRRGAMTREQGVELVKLYDGAYPSESEELYLEYYEMTKEEFQGVLLKWANKKLFDIEGDQIVPKFSVS